MTKTTNYQLNQWEKSDRILMDDFNADNAIIDAALFSKLGRLQKIKEIPVDHDLSGSSDRRTVTVKLNDIDWDKWYLVAAILPCSGASRTDTMHIQFSNISVIGGTGGILAEGKPSSRGCVFLPMGRKENPIRGIALPTADIVVSESDFRSLTDMVFVYSGSESHTTGGTKIVLWGIPA